MLVAVAVLLFFTGREHGGRVVRAPEPAPLTDPRDEVRIVAGLETGTYVDALEHTWQSDRNFSGGYIAKSARTHPVLGTRDQRLYQTRRDGRFNYDIPLKPGTYQLNLYFAETVFGENNVAGGGETSRMFNVVANGRTILDLFDPIGDAGAAVADVKVFNDIRPAPDGKLHLQFLPLSNGAFVNAIEIVPSAPGHIRPIRIVARDRGLKDSLGRYWDPDRYAQGGQLIPRPESNVSGDDPELYRNERFGNITYTLPVARGGRYGLSMYFSENWFGTGMPGGGGIGSRVFDILVNGVVLRRNFDILRDAGGNNRSSIVSVHGLEANHQGKIVISLTPAVNYALINALEVVDESH